MARFSLPALRAAAARRLERQARKHISELDPHILRDLGLEPRRPGPDFSALYRGRL